MPADIRIFFTAYNSLPPKHCHRSTDRHGSVAESPVFRCRVNLLRSQIVFNAYISARLQNWEGVRIGMQYSTIIHLGIHGYLSVLDYNWLNHFWTWKWNLAPRVLLRGDAPSMFELIRSVGDYSLMHYAYSIFFSLSALESFALAALANFVVHHDALSSRPFSRISRLNDNET